ERRGAMDRAVVMKANPGQQRPGKGRHQPAAIEPVPEDAAAVDRMRAKVRLVRPVGAARTPAQFLVRLEQPHARAALGACDRRGQARDSTSDACCLAHVVHCTGRLASRTVPVVEHSKGPVDLLVELHSRGDLPLYEQLERTLRAAIRDGRLQAGTRLPSSRGLAAELGISRGVVTSAYDQLVAEGYLETRQGAPVRVAP